jgi:hydrogenase-4 component B
MTLALILGCIAVQLLTGLIAASVARTSYARMAVYDTTFLACATIVVLALLELFTAGRVPSLVLPFGIPWVGGHFRLDALAAFFLVVVNLGGMAASAYGIGYGLAKRHRSGCCPCFRSFSPP